MRSAVVSVIATWVFILLLVLADNSKAQPQVRWVSQCYNTIDSFVSALNSLPTGEQRMNAKVVVAPSTRNVMGFLGDPYCLIYPTR